MSTGSMGGRKATVSKCACERVCVKINDKRKGVVGEGSMAGGVCGGGVHVLAVGHEEPV